MVSDKGVVSPGTRFAAIISQAHVGASLAADVARPHQSAK
jgi:hypothetical protein